MPFKEGVLWIGGLADYMTDRFQVPVESQLSPGLRQQSLLSARVQYLGVTGCSEDLLRKTFSTRYESVKTASVQVDSSHGRKPYGFVRFTDQEDQRDALIHMNGFTRMGEKPIKVSMAIPKKKAVAGAGGESGVESRIMAGLVFKELSQGGNFQYEIRLGAETWELEARTKETE